MTRPRPYADRPTPSRMVAAAACVLATALSGCSGSGDQPSAEPSAEPSGGVAGAPSRAEEPAAVRTSASIERVDGRLAPADRTRLRERIVPVVDAWIDGAYGGDYPRDDFAGAFDSFTDRAAALARGDAALTSNASLGPRLDDVRPTRRQVRLDVLAVDGHAVAVTARVYLALRLSGEITRTDAISGSLYLTYEKSADAARGAGWRVFGYDLSRKEI